MALILWAAVQYSTTVTVAQSGTLDTVKQRDAVRCAVSQNIPGFAVSNDKGEWSGFDVDFCRALAAAIFNDPGKVDYRALAAKERVSALLQKKSISLLVTTTG